MPAFSSFSLSHSRSVWQRLQVFPAKKKRERAVTSTRRHRTQARDRQVESLFAQEHDAEQRLECSCLLLQILRLSFLSDLNPDLVSRASLSFLPPDCKARYLLIKLGLADKVGPDREAVRERMETRRERRRVAYEEATAAGKRRHQNNGPNIREE